MGRLRDITLSKGVRNGAGGLFIMQAISRDKRDWWKRLLQTVVAEHRLREHVFELCALGWRTYDAGTS